eukprot:6184552-Pleurochrysis_carterae.AAC.1
MNEALAAALAGAIGARTPLEGLAPAPNGSAPADTVQVRGGKLAQGASLAGDVRAAVEAARREPAPFASMRNREPADEAGLAVEPLPGDLFAPQPTAREGKRARAKARRPLPRDAAEQPEQTTRGGA